MNEIENKCLTKAYDYLSRRPHSVYELRTKLKGKKKQIFDTSTINKIIDECLRLGFLNDENFAKMYIEELKSNGRGWFYINQKLKQKGIANEIILIAKEELWSQDEEKEIIKDVAINKLKLLRREKDFYKKKNKLYRFLVSRGFSSYSITDLIDDLLTKEDDDE